MTVLKHTTDRTCSDKEKKIDTFKVLSMLAVKEKLTKGPDDDRKVLRAFSYSPHPNQKPYTSLKASEAFTFDG